MNKDKVLLLLYKSWNISIAMVSFDRWCRWCNSTIHYSIKN